MPETQASGDDHARRIPSVRSTIGCGGCDADQGSLHLTVAAAAELRTRNLESTGRRRDEFDHDRVADLRHPYVYLQLRNREAVDRVLRPDHEPHGLARRYLNGRRIERRLARQDLDLVDWQIGGGHVM